MYTYLRPVLTLLFMLFPHAQMYTYYLRPVLVGHEAQISSQSGAQHRLEGSSVGDSTLNAAFLEEGQGDAVHRYVAYACVQESIVTA
jgi:hypothetical protein